MKFTPARIVIELFPYLIEGIGGKRVKKRGNGRRPERPFLESGGGREAPLLKKTYEANKKKGGEKKGEKDRGKN